MDGILFQGDAIAIVEQIISISPLPTRRQEPRICLGPSQQRPWWGQALKQAFKKDLIMLV